MILERFRTRPLLLLLLLFALSYFALIGWSLAQGPGAGVLTVTFLDVGQGDAAVVRSPGGRVLLVDTGGIFSSGTEEGTRVVAPYLRHMGINRVDGILLTHPHADHIGGADALLRLFPTGLLMDNGAVPPPPIESRILYDAHRDHVRYAPAARGQQIDLGDGVTATVLSPIDSEKLGPTNDASIVVRLAYGRSGFLLTGDAEAGEEAELIQSRQPLACDVLKVGHHGSTTSTTPEFLAAAHPRIAVVSVGVHNLYGHPSPEVIARLIASGAKVYRTDQDGAVTCTSDGSSAACSAMEPWASH